MINISADKGKFIIQCPYFKNDKIKDIPGKRWHNSKKLYMAPYSRKAVNIILSLIDDNMAVVDEKAKVLIDVVATHDISQDAFPDYKFKTEPMPHQQKALEFLWNKRYAALFMAMRTGKTKVSIDWACMLHQEKKIKALLIFCPISVRGSWESQIHEHGPADILVGRYDLSKTSGKTAQEKFCKADHLYKAMIVGIESMAAGGASEYVRQFIVDHKELMCVVDESHLIKTHDATRTDVITMLGSLCKYRVILTGTPIASNILDLYSQFRFLHDDIIMYPDYYTFKAQYVITGGYENKQIIGYMNIDELMSNVSPYIYQVNADDVIKLPPKMYQIREVELPGKIRSLYNQISTHKVIGYNDKELIISNPLDRLTRLSLLTNGIMTTGENGDFEYYWVHNAKINELMNLIEEAPIPTVIWTTRRYELKMIREALNKKGIQTVEIHGDVSENDRIKAVEDFQSGKVNYLISNTAVGGTGIKLSRAKMLVYMSNSFKYVDRKQSEERATDFQNPDSSVLVVDIIATNTVDDGVIQPALKAKQDVATYVNGEIGKLKLLEGL